MLLLVANLIPINSYLLFLVIQYDIWKPKHQYNKELPIILIQFVAKIYLFEI